MDFVSANKMCSFCGTAGESGVGFNGGLGAMICDDCVVQFHAGLATAGDQPRPPWDAMTDAELLASLPLILRSAEQNMSFAQEWVNLLRSRKISWAEIGKVLGVSRQAVWERFADRTGKTASA